jgi:hypothetical protein
MIPLKDENPIYTTPIVVYILIAINIVMFLHEISLESKLEGFFELYALIHIKRMFEKYQELVKVNSQTCSNFY